MPLKPKPLPSQELLLRLLRYEPETGMLYWRPRPRELCPSDRDYGRWNTCFAGRPALSYRDAGGYLRGCVNSVAFLAHRIIWKMQTGEEPDQIDHIDGSAANNRWCNLRSTSKGGNMRNRALPRSNKSGHIGIHFRDGKWAAQISRRGKKIWIGQFAELHIAVAARQDAEQRGSYHENHGRRPK